MASFTRFRMAAFLDIAAVPDDDDDEAEAEEDDIAIKDVITDFNRILKVKLLVCHTVYYIVPVL